MIHVCLWAPIVPVPTSSIFHLARTPMFDTYNGRSHDASFRRFDTVYQRGHVIAERTCSDPQDGLQIGTSCFRCIHFAYLDRVNISFAALTMNEELGMSPALCGAIAGIFFLGGPLAGLLLQFDGIFGLPAWRFLILSEAVPAVILRVLCLKLLVSHPREARWLSTGEKNWLVARLDTEKRSMEAGTDSTKFWRTIVDVKVLVLASAQILMVIAFTGFALWLPQVIVEWVSSSLTVSLLSSLPFLVAIPVILTVSRLAYRTQCPARYVVMPYRTVAVGLLWTAVAGVSAWSLIELCLIAIGNFAGQPSFFSIPAAFLSGASLSAAVAVAVAVISSISNPGGFIGPYAVGALHEVTDSFAAPFAALAGLALVAAYCSPSPRGG